MVLEFGMWDSWSRTNRLIMYPVENRTTATLKAILTRHIQPGSRVFTDGWAGYKFLTEAGYEHYTVNHTNTFKQVYEQVETGNITVECHTKD